VRLSEIAGLLGTAAGGLASLAAMRLEALRKRTKEQLLEVAKALDLKGVSKLTKDELAEHVLRELKARARDAEAQKAKGSKEAKEKPAKKGKAAAAKAAAVPRPKAAAPPPKKERAPKVAAAPPPKKERAPKVAAAPPPKKERAPKVAAAPRGAPEARALHAGEDPSGAAKLDLGPAGKAEKPVGHIPWSYGLDRVVAAAVDPDNLYVYWEVGDEAIEKARADLGPGGPDAWLNLRIYDTTSLIFDGTNAHSYFDRRIERSDRQWFFAIEKPTSTAYVDVGLRSTEGFFVKIARSGRVDFPRKDQSPWTEPEWLTVLPATGEVKAAGTGSPFHGGAGAPGASPQRVGEPPPPFAPIALWRLHESGANREARIAELLEAGWERVEWQEMEGEGWYELEGRVLWQGPVTTSTWEAGPFTYPVEVDPPAREEWRGPAFSFKVGGVTHVVYGPWEVVIRNLGAHHGRAVLGRWEMYRSWVAEGGREIRGAGRADHLPLGASEHLGASERRWLSGSELRLGGASELFRLGASEVRLGGASEVLFAGASQWMAAGASERRLLGASELRLGGASERMLGGASERLGGSERRLGGGSEERLGGGSEERLGTGEKSPAYPKVEE